MRNPLSTLDKPASAHAILKEILSTQNSESKHVVEALRILTRYSSRILESDDCRMIVRLSCTALWNLSSDHQTRNLAIRANGTELVLFVIESVAKVFRDVNKDTDIRLNSSMDENDKVIVAYEWILLMAAGVISNLTYDEDIYIIAGPDNHRRSMTVMEFVSQVEDSAVIDAIMNLMHKNQDDLRMQEKGCWILWCLSHNDIGRDMILRKAAYKSVLCAMMQNQNVAEIQEQACGCIWNLTDCGLKYVTNYFRTKSPISEHSRLDYLPLMFEFAWYLQTSLRSYANNARISRNVCGALANLTTLPEVGWLLLRLNCLSDLSRALTLNPIDAELAENGQQAIHNLSRLQPEWLESNAHPLALRSFLRLYNTDRYPSHIFIRH